MKKASIFLGALIISLCTNVFATSVGEKVSYARNSDRTSFVIRTAEGKLTVMEKKDSSYQYGAGYIVKMDYKLNVLLRGKQEGDIGMFLPEAIFNETFHEDLAKDKEMDFGSFTLMAKGMGDATDSQGKTYEDCAVMGVKDVDHNYEPGQGSKMGKVLWINHTGKIEYVTDLKITIKAHKDVGVIGAVQIDLAGKSNNGIPFTVGLDATP